MPTILKTWPTSTCSSVSTDILYTLRIFYFAIKLFSSMISLGPNNNVKISTYFGETVA